MQSDEEKAQDIKKKRRLAAKGLAERKDGKPIDPMEDVGSLDIDTDANRPETPAEKQEDVAKRGFAVGLGMKRQ
jgi:hypothetical protein